MSRIRSVKTTRQEREVDELVTAQALEDGAWGKPVEVTPRTVPTSIRLSPQTILKAKFFSRIHHERGYQTWLKRVVEERIDTEYEMYRRLKKNVV